MRVKLKLQNQKVEKIGISADRTQAQVITQEGDRVMVNLPPNDPDLINILQENDVDIAVLPQGDDGLWFRVLSSLLVPVLLLVERHDQAGIFEFGFSVT